VVLVITHTLTTYYIFPGLAVKGLSQHMTDVGQMASSVASAFNRLDQYPSSLFHRQNSLLIP